MRCVSIITGPDTHLDHLGILSALLKIPLIVSEEKLLRLCQQFYPDIDVSYRGLEDLSLNHLAHHYDVIFETAKFWAAELTPLLALHSSKKMRFVFCPHGNSDKGHTLYNHVDQDLSLVYGEHLYDLLKQNGAADKITHLIRTGNYRYPYYRRYCAFYDMLAQEIVFSRFHRVQPILLYAPTWEDKENPTSFFSATEVLIEQLSSNYNLLIKLHPFLMEDHPARTLQMMLRYENHPSALFLTDFPPIYPLLARCAAYIGDYSSIGYDFLAFDKPLYFLNPKKTANGSALHSTGLEIPNGENVNYFLEKTLKDNSISFAEQRKKIYLYAFGEEKEPEHIKSEILEKLTTENK